MTTPDLTLPAAPAAVPTTAAVSPWRLSALIGLGGLFAGVTGPLLSAFVPVLVQQVLGDRRTMIGGVMAIDNVLLLLLVPWAGPASDRAKAGGRGRLALVLLGYALAAIGMAMLPFTAGLGLVALIAAITFLHSGINLQRAPFQALMADMVPSRWRSLANGSITFQMCVGAIVFLMLGRALGMRPAFLVAGASVLVIALAFVVWLREPRGTQVGAADDVSFRAMGRAALSTLRGEMPGVRAIFVSVLFLQITFQTFTTWYALHATERFGIAPEDVTIGFIAWAMGGVIGALPAGAVGVRIGRRNAMLVGFVLMALSMVLLDRVTTASQAVPLLALASAAWTFPTVNAYPMFVEPIPESKRGVLASLYLLCMALGGALGDPFNGRVFDTLGNYRAMFLVMAAYSALAVVAVLMVPRGTGEAGTGPEGAATAA